MASWDALGQDVLMREIAECREKHKSQRVFIFDACAGSCMLKRERNRNVPDRLTHHWHTGAERVAGMFAVLCAIEPGRREMKKIPTIFERDWNGDRNRVMDTPNPEAAWVFAGEGIPTRKIDGTSCLIRDGKLYKRRELRPAERSPADFELADEDDTTGKKVGWVPVGDGPEDRWHREAFQDLQSNGTYELVGPRVQGNPEKIPDHRLIGHDAVDLILESDFERTFDGIRTFLDGRDIEGIVFHHPDGRMAKIKGRDFGFKRPK